MVLPDAGYPWQLLLGLGSFLLSWLHLWHVWNDTTNATALKSSCPSVIQNPSASSQPYKSAGFNQSGSHLMQSLGSHSFVVSDKWSKHAVTKAGDTADLSVCAMSFSAMFLLIALQNLKQLSWPLPFHSRSAPVHGDLGSIQGCCSTWGSRLESTPCFSILLFYCIKVFLKKISPNLGSFHTAPEMVELLIFKGLSQLWMKVYVDSVRCWTLKIIES